MHKLMIPGSEYLDRRVFTMAVGAALALHLTGFVIWHLMPRTQVIEVPVRALNIKLGDADGAVDQNPPPQEPTFNIGDENTIPRMVRDEQPVRSFEKAVTAEAAVNAFDKAMSTNVPPPKITESASKLSNAITQFRRQNNPPAQPAAPPAAQPATPVPGTSSAKDAEIMSRYEQLISQWLAKFKVYPEEAKRQGITGVATVRIRIDRQGTIGYYIIEQSSGYQILDRAAIDMVRRANPVPAVPHDYPASDLMEFRIPIDFSIK